MDAERKPAWTWDDIDWTAPQLTAAQWDEEHRKTAAEYVVRHRERQRKARRNAACDQP